MLSDVVIDLKKQIHVMQEKLDNHVVSPNLYSKAVNCSTQTINLHYNECNNNARQRLNESSEYIANCRLTTQFQDSNYEDKSTTTTNNSKDISCDMSRVILDASLSSPSQFEDGNAKSAVGFSEENSMLCSQPCNFNEISGNSPQSCVPGNHVIKQNNNPIPTRITRRFDNRSKFRYVKSNWKITSNKCRISNQISSSQFDRTSKPIVMGTTEYFNKIQKNSNSE